MAEDFEFRGKRVKCQIVEEGKNYKTILIHFEIPDVLHHGFLMKRGEKIVAKGELAKKIRDQNIDGVEMVVAPPADTNAILMMRINRDEKEILDKILPIVYDFLKEKGFIE